MSTLTPERRDAGASPSGEEFDQDLSALSCFAAAEIDRLIRGDKAPPHDYLPLLKRKLQSWIPRIEGTGSRSLADSNTMVAIAMAFPGIRENANSRLKDVLDGAKGMRDSIVEIVDHPDTFDSPDGKRKLQVVLEFCLELSRSIRSMGYPPDMQAYLKRRQARE